MEGKENSREKCLKDSYANFRDEIRLVEDILTKAVKATRLAEGVSYRSVQLRSEDKEGKEYVALFGLTVDLGKIPASTITGE